MKKQPLRPVVCVATVISLWLLVVGTSGCTSDQAPSPSAPTQPTEQEQVGDAEAATNVPPPDSATQMRFEEAMTFAREQELHRQPPGQVMQTMARQFLGEPYIVGPLDQTAEEELVCRLNGFDCFTFVEAVLALTRAIEAQEYSYEAYKRYTRQQRYRGDQMGYCNRLHYFTDWIAYNEERGVVRNITEEIGGEPLPKTLDFMSTHRESYDRFAENDSIYQCIKAMEEQLRDLEHHHVPQDSIRAVYDQLRAGDLIAMSTDIEGLDVTHTGLVYKGDDGSTGLLHASTSGGVKISPDLQSYVQDVDAQIGIIVARPTP